MFIYFVTFSDFWRGRSVRGRVSLYNGPKKSIRYVTPVSNYDTLETFKSRMVVTKDKGNVPILRLSE